MFISWMIINRDVLLPPTGNSLNCGFYGHVCLMTNVIGLAEAAHAQFGLRRGTGSSRPLDVAVRVGFLHRSCVSGSRSRRDFQTDFTHRDRTRNSEMRLLNAALKRFRPGATPHPTGQQVREEPRDHVNKCKQRYAI